MLISYNWLKQFLKLEQDSKAIAEMLTHLGLEVSGITEYVSVPGGLEGVVVGHVVDCFKHPNADKLKIAKVDIGGNEPVQIVCGAPNIQKGQKVPVATIGTVLTSPEGEEWKIKKGKIRGEASHGMICAEDELGLGDNHDGIMVLDGDYAPGMPCSEIFEIEQDEVFDIDLTPNRADAMSHFGVARDLKAALVQQKKNVELITPSVSNFSIDNRSLKMDVEVLDTEGAPRYCGLTISGLVVQPSPDWLKNRLQAIGVKTINNVVDITNYVLHELGQPLHAFDADRIYGNKVIVRRAEPGTRFITLDGDERILHEEDLMICDAEKPMCIAGVFGGINTGVTENTKSIFLESAYFDPVTIRKTSKRHGLQTDASFRFERGIDINITDYALQRAALLIREIAGGYITSDLVDLYPKKIPDHHVFLSFEKIDSLIGEVIPRDTIKSILASLEIKVKSVTESGLGLVIPFYRVDVQREVDVIEEILRVYGYNRIRIPEKFQTSIAPQSAVASYKLEDLIGDYLASQGFFEIVGNSLTSENFPALLGPENVADTVQILNPLSSDLAVMRPSLVFSALQTLAFNLNRKQANLKFFEFGKVYRRDDGKNAEENQLSLFISGNVNREHWNSPGREVDIFYLKSQVKNIFKRLGIEIREDLGEDQTDFSDSVVFRKKKDVLARMGYVKNDLLDYFDIKQPVLGAILEWDGIVAAISEEPPLFKSIPKYPEVRRDLALLVDESVAFNEIETISHDTERKLLKRVNLFDVYTGNKLPKGKKSYAVSFVLGDENKTLTDDRIEKVMDKLVKKFESALGAELR